MSKQYANPSQLKKRTATTQPTTPVELLIDEACQANAEASLPLDYCELKRSQQMLAQVSSKLLSTLQETTRKNELLKQKNKALLLRATAGKIKRSIEEPEIAHIKAEFVSIVSHEMRTPLTTIHGSLKLLAGGIVPNDSAQAQQLIEVAAGSSQQLVQLVDDILRLESLGSKDQKRKRSHDSPSPNY